eukprot:TRINITY_DN9918_c0_g1_i1.p1 TRINITY_DN9918_c0_g1~~TRINITY_DN9918_c0_g1_i1.p1  ORF type:complete len:758 (+),score=155.21 TRINITY_DN9918_c0_g1_i1:44-2317(+)
MATPRAASRLPVPIEELENLTDLTEIQRAHDLLLEEEAALAAEIREIINRKPFVDAQIRAILEIPEHLEPILADASRLDDSLRDVSRQADEISIHVRRLDQLNERITSAMKRTDDIIDLKTCIDGVQNAMASEDYASAASYVNRYLNFDKSILDRSSVELLETAERNLADIIRMKCDSAIAANDTDLVFKFALLMPLIGNATQGIEKISVHFSKLLAKDEQAIYAEMDKSVSNNTDQKISYAAAVGQLLQRLERRLKRYRTQLETACGRSGVAQLLINVQSHVNERTLNLLEIFIREWQLQATLNNLTKQPSSKGTTAGLTTALARGTTIEYRDPREYAPLLDQIVGISQSLESYARFSSYLITAPPPQQQQGQSSPSAPANSNFDSEQVAQLDQQLRKAFTQSKLNGRLHEVLGWYVKLEQYYMDEAVKMAVVEDQLPQIASNPDEEDAQNASQPQQLTSSIVDDVFFVIKECLQRAQMTYNVNTICAIINLAEQQLSSLFLETLTHNSKQQSTLQATLTRKAAATPMSIAVALNNLELSAEYIKRLKAEMDSSTQRQFSSLSKDVQKIGAVLDDIHQTEKRFSHILHGNMELLATSLLPRLQASLEARLIDASYVLTEEQYAQNQINDPYMLQFIAEVEASLATFQRFLTPKNTELLFETISRAFAEQIESHILLQSATTYSATGSGSSSTPGSNEKAELKRFNLLGAQQFDRDIRNLLGFFTANMVSKTVRDKFARINQMAFLLNVEKESEVLA